VLAGLLALAWGLAGGLPRSEAETTLLHPVDDAHVAAKTPDRNYGAAATLEADGSPVLVTYLKFDLRGVTQAVQRATLRMYKTNGSAGVQAVWNVDDDTWSERALTYRNRPARTTPVTTFVPGSVAKSTVEADLTAAVAAGAGTLLSLALDSTSSDGYAFSSQEAASNQVALAIELAAPGATTTTAAATTTTTAGATTTTTASTTTTTTLPSPALPVLTPTDDAYVAGDQPDANAGAATDLRSDASPVLVTYLKFDLREVTLPVARATLRMYKTNGSAGLQTIWNVDDDTWSEATLTFGNRPAHAGALTSFVPGTAAGTSVDVDLTAAVAARAGTLLSFTVESTSSDGYAFNSKEAAANRVGLVVEAGGEPPPPPPPPPPPGSDPVVVAAGDVACPGVCGQDETAALIDAINPAAVLGLGDYQYEFATPANLAAYYDPYWGRFKARTYPASGGSHDFYGTGDYLTYFNAGGPVVLQPEGSYSFDLGAWHLVALNSFCFERATCDEVAVTNWLIADLAAHPAPCTLAYFHQPYWTSPSNHNRTLSTKPWIQVLFDAGADVVLQAHNHVYERFAPQTPDDGRDDSRGLTAFTVGTGGRSLYAFTGTAANSLVRNSDTFGVLELTLRPGGYDFRFVPEPGRAFSDSGSGSCH
jgi:hypothetical protein